MFQLILGLHVFLCLVLIGLVMIQQGKGADMGATFGGGGSNTIFGAGGATPLIIRLTTLIAVLFMITSVLLVRTYRTQASGIGSTNLLEGSLIKDQPVPVAPAKVAPGKGDEKADHTVEKKSSDEQQPAPSGVANPQGVAVPQDGTQPKSPEGPKPLPNP